MFAPFFIDLVKSTEKGCVGVVSRLGFGKEGGSEIFPGANFEKEYARTGISHSPPIDPIKHPECKSNEKKKIVRRNGMIERKKVGIALTIIIAAAVNKNSDTSCQRFLLPKSGMRIARMPAYSLSKLLETFDRMPKGKRAAYFFV